MVTSKLLICVCLGILSVNATPAVRSIFDTVELLLQTFSTTLNKSILDADVELASLNSTFKSLSQRAKDTVDSEFKAAADAFLQEIAALKTQASNLGIDISECVADSEDQINDLPLAASSSVSNCLQIEVDTGYNTVSKCRSNILSTSGQEEVFRQELEQCQKEAEILQAACATTLATNITLSIDQVPNEINGYVQEASKYTPTFKEALLICTSGQVAAVSSRGALIVANVTGCANELFWDNTQPGTTNEPTNS